MGTERTARAKSDLERENDWTLKIAKAFVGRTIKGVHLMSEGEAEELGWHNRVFVFCLDNDEIFFASRDDEGNGPGAIFASFEDLPCVPVF